jgi:hypothetical protein
MKKYRPSNGSEGECFMSEHCYQCIHENPDPEKKPKCEIMTFTMCFGVDEPEYPKEWCYDENNRPTCTKFQKWDWGNDGDPNDPENPKAPIPEDPNQLCLPFIFGI